LSRQGQSQQEYFLSSFTATKSFMEFYCKTKIFTPTPAQGKKGIFYALLKLDKRAHPNRPFLWWCNSFQNCIVTGVGKTIKRIEASC
jgi:hypothetical protein